MASVRSLYVALKMQTDDYNKKIKAAQQEAKDFQRILRPTSQVLSEMGKTMVAVGGVVTLALLGMAKKAADYGDEMLEASQKTGITTKQLASLRLVAEQSGSSFEGITSATTKLSKTLFEASTKGGEAGKTFAALGISVKDSTGHVRDASAVLPELADRFAKMKDGTEKTALAMRLFGKAGADMIPVLNQGAEGFRHAAEMVEKYNVDIGDAGNKLGDQFNDTLKETALATQGLANQIGKALLPGMIRFVEIGNNVIAMVSRWAKEHPGLTRVVAGTALALTGTGGLLIAMSTFMMIAPGMIANLKLIGAAFMGLSVPMRIVVIALTALTAAFLAFPKIRGPIIETLAAINGVVFANIDAFGRLAGILIRLGKGEFTAAWETFKDLPQQMEQSFKDRMDMVRNFASGIGASVKDINAALTMKPGEMPDFKGIGADISGLGKETSEATNQVEQLWKQLKRENSEADALQAVLYRADAAQIRFTQTSATLGSKIREVSEEFLAMGMTVPQIIASFDSIFFAQEQLAKITEETVAKFERERDVLREISEVPIVNGGMTPKLEAIKAEGAFIARVREATENLKRQKDQVADLSRQILVLNQQGMSARDIEHALGVSMEEVSRRAKELGVQLDPVTRKIVEQAVRTETLRRAWGDTMASISDQLVDFVVDWEFTWKRVADIGKGIFKDLARSFLDGVVKPLKDGLRDLGETAATKLGSILFGGKSGQQGKAGGGGILGGLLGSGGGLLGSIFGGDGQPAGGGTGGTPPFVPGAMGALSGQLSGLAAKLNPAMMGVSIANDAFDLVNKITGKIGAGRDSANEIVKAENAFRDTLATILADTALSATNKLKQIDNVWEAFQANLARFSAAGGEGGVTANQSFAKVSPLVSQIRIDRIKEGAVDGSGGSSVSGPITINLYTNAKSPEEWLRWFQNNEGEIRTQIIKAVDISKGLVTAH